jgi:hypothetical protein
MRRDTIAIRSAIGATTINPELLTCAEKLQYDGYLCREETNAAILVLAAEGVAIKDIVRLTGHSPQACPPGDPWRKKRCLPDSAELD